MFAPPFRKTARGPSHGDGVLLAVMGPNVFATYALPAQGTLTVGRADDVQVTVPDVFASRHHARLHVQRGEISIEDLGSANGTRVGQHQLEPGERVPLAVGDAISVGATVLMLQPSDVPTAERLAGSLAGFAVRVAEACAEAAATGRPASVMWLEVVGGIVDDRLPLLVERALDGLAAVVAAAPTETAALLVGVSPAAVEQAGRRFVEALAAGGTHARCGHAAFGIEARDGNELIGRARAAAQASAVAAGEPIVVKDPRMRRVYDLAQQAAAGTVNVLVLGETGVGKDVLARLVHQVSPRAGGPFVRIDCASLSETLLESELFGYERGAFTGAIRSKIGLIESGAGGTAFLDEIGELPLKLQAKLLCVLETREVMPVGAVTGRAVDVRFIAATNRNLEDEVQAGSFRKDLFFRLSGFSLFIPPLRARPSEIPPLAEVLVTSISRRLGRLQSPGFSPEVLARLESHAWPGNVRELRNAMERAVLLCKGPQLLPEHLVLETDARAQTLEGDRDQPPRKTGAPERSTPEAMPRAVSDGRGEKLRIEAALAECGGNQSRAAKRLGMPRSTFILRLEEYGIVRPRKGRAD